MNRSVKSRLAMMLGAGVVAICAPVLAADVDISVGLPGASLVPQPVYVQPQPVYVEPRPIVVQQRVYVQRETVTTGTESARRTSANTRRKKDRHGKHRGHDHDQDD